MERREPFGNKTLRNRGPCETYRSACALPLKKLCLFVVFCTEAIFDALEDVFQVGFDDLVEHLSSVAFAC